MRASRLVLQQAQRKVGAKKGMLVFGEKPFAAPVQGSLSVFGIHSEKVIDPTKFGMEKEHHSTLCIRGKVLRVEADRVHLTTLQGRATRFHVVIKPLDSGGSPRFLHYDIVHNDCLDENKKFDPEVFEDLQPKVGSYISAYLNKRRLVDFKPVGDDEVASSKKREELRAAVVRAFLESHLRRNYGLSQLNQLLDETMDFIEGETTMVEAM